VCVPTKSCNEEQINMSRRAAAAVWNKDMSAHLYCSHVVRTGHSVPVARYFFWVGSALIALLLVSGWYWPSEPAAPTDKASAETPVQQTIRIQSARKLPDRVEFDTSLPTIAPPPQAAVAGAPSPPEAAAAAEPAQPSVLEARAEMKPAAAPPAAPPRRQARVHHRSPRQSGPQPMWADGYGYGYAPAPRRWSWNW
jgi:hypothetical protein